MMRVALLFLLTIRGFGQSGHAAALLQEVAGAVRSTRSWRIEGSVEESAGGEKSASADFKLLIDAAGRVRFEQTGKFPALIVCEADKVSVYSLPLRRYREVPRAGTDLCAPVIDAWETLPKTVLSPLAEPGPPGQNCELVTGTLKPELASLGEARRTLCIDTGRKQVVWEKFESRYSTRTYTYRLVDRNVEIPAGFFVFAPLGRGVHPLRITSAPSFWCD